MLNLFNQLLDATTYPDWITSSFPIIRIVLMSLIVLCTLAIIIIILRMEINPEGGRNVISGSNDSFYAQNQSSTKEGRLKKMIIIASITLLVLTLLFFVSYMIYPA